MGCAAIRETGASGTVAVSVGTVAEDDNEEDATINKCSKFRVEPLKFNQSTYFGYVELAILFIASISLVRDEYIDIESYFNRNCNRKCNSTTNKTKGKTYKTSNNSQSQ